MYIYFKCFVGFCTLIVLSTNHSCVLNMQCPLYSSLVITDIISNIFTYKRSVIKMSFNRQNCKSLHLHNYMYARNP